MHEACGFQVQLIRAVTMTGNSDIQEICKKKRKGGGWTTHEENKTIIMSIGAGKSEKGKKQKCWRDLKKWQNTLL